MTRADRTRRRLAALYHDRAVLLARIAAWREGPALFHDLHARLRAVTHEALRLEATLKGKAR